MTDEEDEQKNPFEEMDSAVGERDGDPFERLDATESPEQRELPDLETGEDGTGEREDGEEKASPDDRSDTDRSESDGEREMNLGVGRRDTDGPDDMPPLSDVGKRDGDPFERFDDAFDEVDVEGVDPDDVWQDLTSAESRGSVGEATERTYAEVSKHSYCEQCEFFSEPPDIHCTHEGTDIVEFLDMETVRVVDCPVVTERKKLEEGGHGDE